MSENQMNVENKGREVSNFYHPFWSLFNDCFSYEDASDVMKTDVSENENGYELDVEVPGVDKKDIRLVLDKGYLSISAKTRRKEVQGRGKNLRTERSYGSFSRSFYVGNNVKREDIDAACDNGILTITIKKPTEVKQEEKFIEIK